ncbi:MAG: Excinuclease subunit domain protein [Clostridia bacterium]|jgi:excinuclease ABC subunit C|nr:Excinuclease subunit domain protein [Clostridia bacterium]
MTIEELRQQAKVLPSLPGVYMMKDRLGNIIYVGKSKELKKRVKTYFGKVPKESSKIKRLVAHIDHFDYTVTDTELDALLLECRLIKKLKPIYNTLLKNDKRYRFIKINKNAELPRAEVAYEKGEEGEYFGPYDMPYLLSIGVEAINEYYQLPECKTKVPRKDCLSFRMNRCMGPCEDDALLEYRGKIESAVSFLEGKDIAIINHYEKKMSSASDKYDFEKAANYRDYITVLKMLGFKKEAIQFSLENQKGIMLLKMPKGGIKLYLLSGTQIIYMRCFEEISLPLQKDKQRELIRHILDLARLYFQKEVESRKYLAKAEVDEALITYYYLKTKSDSYYERFNDVFFEETLQREIGRIFNGDL